MEHLNDRTNGPHTLDSEEIEVDKIAHSEQSDEAHQVDTSLLPTRRTSSLSIQRGITSVIHPGKLREHIWYVTLSTLNRFRVIRTIDIAIAYAPERGFKAALSSAQETMRKLRKAGHVQHYRTDRFQHVYGLTASGARWLSEHGVHATPSVRRVSEMTNPEHRLWTNFFVLACEARGITALNESELLSRINKGKQGQDVVSALLTIKVPHVASLRPDLLSFEEDGVTWYEVDRSRRGADRTKSLRGLARAVGRNLSVLSDIDVGNHYSKRLRRVVFLCRDAHIFNSIHAVLNREAAVSKNELLAPGIAGSRRLIRVEHGIYEVWAATFEGSQSAAVDTLVGHVVVQMLPIWMPKVRLSRNFCPPTNWGWFDENFLPYCRPASQGIWTMPNPWGITATEPSV